MQEPPLVQTQEEAPLPTPAAEAPPAPEAGEPQTTVAAEETTPAPEAGEVTPETPTLDPYEVLERPEFKTHLQRRDSRVEERLVGQFNQQLEAATKEWETTQAHQTIYGLDGSLTQRLEASDLEGGDKMVARLEKFREPYMEAYKKQLQGEGMAMATEAVIGLMKDGLNLRDADEIQELRQRRGVSWKEVFDKYGSLLKKGSDDRAHKRLKEERNAAGASSQQVQQAKERGAVGAIAPGSSAGSTDLNKSRQDYAEGRISTTEAERLGIVK